MKVLVTGVGGQLGHDVMNELHKKCDVEFVVNGGLWNSD